MFKESASISHILPKRIPKKLPILVDANTGAVRNKKKGGTKFFLLCLKHMQIGNFSFRQIVTNYKGLAITDRSPAVVHATDE